MSAAKGAPEAIARLYGELTDLAVQRNELMDRITGIDDLAAERLDEIQAHADKINAEWRAVLGIRQ